jgi:hypothetical protein
MHRRGIVLWHTLAISVQKAEAVLCLGIPLCGGLTELLYLSRLIVPHLDHVQQI